MALTIPFGCKCAFEPDDHELLVYLSCKSNGESLPAEGFIMEVDLYGLNDPGVLFQRTSEKVVYVFTKLKKVSKNGKRVDRTVSGNRTWKGVDGGKPVHDAQGRLVGEKRNFVLENKMKMKLGYNMTEFSLDNEALRNSRFKDYVVCKIKKKKAKKLRGLKYGDIQEEDTSPSSVSTPPIQNVMAFASEEGFKHQDNSLALNQYQYQSEQIQEFDQYQENSIALSQYQYQYQGEQAPEFQQFQESNEYHFIESVEGICNFMPMVCEGFEGGDQEFPDSEIYQLLFPEEHPHEEVNP